MLCLQRAGMSDTPFTDAEAAHPYSPHGMRKTADLVSANFARELERKNADLLAALQVLTEGWMQRNHPDSPSVTITDSEMADAAYAGRATIAKATGNGQ